MQQTRNVTTGIDDYFSKMKLFTHNARMVLLYSGLTGLVFGVFRLLFNFYVLSLGGYDEAFLGILTSVSSFASLAIALPAVYIVRAFSQKGIMIVTGLISGFVFLGMVLTPYRWPLIILNVIAGLAVSVRQIAIAPFLMDNSSDQERLYVFSFNFGMLTVAGFAGSMLGGYLPGLLGGLVGAGPQDTLSYRLALSSMMLISILAVGPLLLIHRQPRDVTAKQESAWGQGWLLSKLTLPQFILGIGAGLMMPFMNLYYRHVFDKPDSTIGTLFAVGALAMALAQFIAPPLADRMGKIRLTILSQGLSIPFLLSLGLAAWIVPGGHVNVEFWFAVAALAYLFRLALMNLGGPVYQTFALEMVEPRIQPLATSLQGIAFQFGWVVSPYASGWFQTTYGERGFVPVFLSTSVLYVVGIAVTWFFFHDAEKKAATPELSPSQLTG